MKRINPFISRLFFQMLFTHSYYNDGNTNKQKKPTDILTSLLCNMLSQLAITKLYILNTCQVKLFQRLKI